MAHVAHEMQRLGLDAAAADRRRDDVARAHGGQDRAALRRRRPSTCRTRRARSASRATCCPTSCATRYVAEVAADYEKIRAQHARKKGPTLIPLAAARANALPDRLERATRRRCRSRSAGASSATSTWPRSRGTSTGARSSRRGSCRGRFRRSSTIRSSARPRATCYAEGQAMLSKIVDGRWLDGERRGRPLAGQRRGRRHRALRRRDAHAASR